MIPRLKPYEVKPVPSEVSTEATEGIFNSSLNPNAEPFNPDNSVDEQVGHRVQSGSGEIADTMMSDVKTFDQSTLVDEVGDEDSQSSSGEDSFETMPSEISDEEGSGKVVTRPRRARHPPIRLTYDTVGNPTHYPQETAVFVDNGLF